MDKLLGMHPRHNYPAALERRSRVFAPRDVALEAAALAGPAMFDCTRFPGATRLSERQCLINQERAAVGGFPSFCVNCPDGAEIKARHPEGSGAKVKPITLDNRIDKAKELKLAREQGRPDAAPAPEPSSPPEPEKAPVMTSPLPTSRMKTELINTVVLPPGPICQNEGKDMTENMTTPRCPKHPAEPQIVLSGKRAGQFMGACKLCMADRKANGAGRRKKVPPVAAEVQPSAGQAALGEINNITPVEDLRLQLLDKFPALNPSWPPEVQGKWLDGFNKLLDLCGPKNAGGAFDDPIPEVPGPPVAAEVGRPYADLRQVEASNPPRSGAPALKKPKKRRWDKKTMTVEVARSLGLI